MLFLGDFVCPTEKIDALKDCIERDSFFHDDIVVLNLEANILSEVDKRRPLTLWNSPRFIEVFSKAKKVIVSIANNHAYDYPENIHSTIDYLTNNGIGVFGLCNDDGSFNPYEYTDESGDTYAFFGHCWRLYTKTNPNKVNESRIVDCPYDLFSEAVKKYIECHPDVKVYCMMHWNYDMEHLPFPMIRKVAHQLIDYGVEAVIGSHSHRPQGAEIYKGKPIVYCLGNFYIPSGVYFNGNLKYPDCAHQMYVLQLRNGLANIIWYDTDNNNPIDRINVEPVEGPRISNISPFVGMKENDYLLFFKKHRLKRKLVPIFDEMSGMRLKYKEEWAIVRVNIIRAVLKMFNK